MSTITIAVDDQVLERAQRKAAALHTSVPALVQEYLADLAKGAESEAERFARLAREEQEIIDRIGHFSASDRLPRDQLYDRKY